MKKCANSLRIPNNLQKLTLIACVLCKMDAISTISGKKMRNGITVGISCSPILQDQAATVFLV